MGLKSSFAPRIRYHYEKLPETRLNPAHGVWGGVNGQGDLEVCFYSESDELPTCSEQTLEPDGTLGPEIHAQTENARNITRTVHTRVVMNYHTARAVLEWLEDRVSEMEAEGVDLMDFNSGIEQ